MIPSLLYKDGSPMLAGDSVIIGSGRLEWTIEEITTWNCRPVVTCTRSNGYTRRSLIDVDDIKRVRLVRRAEA